MHRLHKLDFSLCPRVVAFCNIFTDAFTSLPFCTPHFQQTNVLCGISGFDASIDNGRSHARRARRIYAIAALAGHAAPMDEKTLPMTAATTRKITIPAMMKTGRYFSPLTGLPDVIVETISEPKPVIIVIAAMAK